MAHTVIDDVVLDYGGTLTQPDAPVVPYLGMRPVDPEVIPALRLLHDQGKRLLLASNTRPYLSRRLALRQAQIEHLFTALFESHDLGFAKPEDAFYECVLLAAKCPPRQVLWVGNNLESDVRGPLRHGMHAVLVAPDATTNDQTLPNGAYSISHVRHLPRLLEEICGC